MATTVKCPVCSTPVAWTDASPWRPFCSERCKTIDLGDWASDRHVIPGSPADSTDQGPASDPDPSSHGSRTH
jgi:endogenous inhibitor of DNA gyrase (YacG/DUF329 family)